LNLGWPYDLLWLIESNRNDLCELLDLALQRDLGACSFALLGYFQQQVKKSRLTHQKMRSSREENWGTLANGLHTGEVTLAHQAPSQASRWLRPHEWTQKRPTEELSAKPSLH
jgi:hypothetical protein